MGIYITAALVQIQLQFFFFVGIHTPPSLEVVRDCSLFMPKGGRCLEWGGKLFKINEKGEVFFLNTVEIRGVNF